MQSDKSAASAAALALPMTVRGQIAGFVLIGHRRQQELFRPDEQAHLARAVQSLGLDLESLRVDALERENAATAQNERRLRLQLSQARPVGPDAALNAPAGL
jgi:hypothetical protein